MKYFFKFLYQYSCFAQTANFSVHTFVMPQYCYLPLEACYIRYSMGHNNFACIHTELTNSEICD